MRPPAIVVGQRGVTKFRGVAGYAFVQKPKLPFVETVLIIGARMFEQQAR